MKLIPYLLIGFILIFSSCSSTFFYSTLNSNNEYLDKTENGDFLLETDSLWIAYCFKGESAPIQITVFNKLNSPLYIDWRRSALIVNETAFSYAKDQLSFSGNSQSSYAGYNPVPEQIYSHADGSFSGVIEQPQDISFIPPHTMISYTPLKLNVNFEKIDKKLYRKGNMGDKDNNVVKVNRIDYTEEDSPLQFESYLTLYSKPESPMTFRQKFYMSNLIKTNSISPSSLVGSLADRGDFFYIEKPANNSFWEVLLGTTIIAGAVAVDIMINTDNSY